MSNSSPFHRQRTNAALVWSFTGVLVALAVVAALSGSVVWAGLWVVVAALVAVPAAVTGDWTAVVPWPLPFCAAVAAVLRIVGVGQELVGYVAVAIVALVAVIEIDAFSSVEMSRRFTVFFAAMTTLAVQAWWTVVQYLSDWWFGTRFLRSQTELQWDIVAVTCVAVGMGGLFVWAFDRFESVGTYDRSIRTEDAS